MAYSNYGQNTNMDDKITYNRSQLNDITNIMHQNLEKVMDREINLKNLEQNADHLNIQANQFQTNSTKTKRFFIFKNAKWTTILIVTIILIIIIIALAIGLGVGLSNKT
jgi:hypothetical protein